MTTFARPRVQLSRVVLICSAFLAADVPLMLLNGEGWRQSLLPGYVIVLVAFGAVFCLRAVTVAGFVTGVAGAGLLLLGQAGLLELLAGAAVLAVVCGIAPGWSRVEAWQATRFHVLTAAEERTLGGRPPVAVGRHRLGGAGVRVTWRTDRVVAAFLVLAFPPSIAAFGLWFVSWVATR